MGSAPYTVPQRHRKTQTVLGALLNKVNPNTWSLEKPAFCLKSLPNSAGSPWSLQDSAKVPRAALLHCYFRLVCCILLISMALVPKEENQPAPSRGCKPGLIFQKTRPIDPQVHISYSLHHFHTAHMTTDTG